MDPTNREHNVEQWLDSALSQYSKAEPRTGLESRVLVNLQAERNRITSRRRWWWAMGAVATAVAVVAAVWVGENGRKNSAGGLAETKTPTHHEEAQRVIEPAQVPQAVHPTKVSASRRPANQPSRELAVAMTPKLEQFPSLRPLSEQEQILMSYVAQYPEKAALVAQAQAEELERDRQEEAAVAAKDTAD